LTFLSLEGLCVRLSKNKRRGSTTLVETEKTPAKDPVCGMSVDPATAKNRFEHDGRTYNPRNGSWAEILANDPDASVGPTEIACLTCQG
jgi:YHS domain-containing protein